MIHIRPATADDLVTIVEFNRRLARETEDKELAEATITRGVERALSQPELCRYFVAEGEGAVVGQTMITYEWTDWRDGLFWWIQSVYVLPDWRGRGVFRALYAHIEQLAHNTPDVRGIRLYVEHNNAPAQQTYSRLGMTPSGHLLYEVDWTLGKK